MMLGRIHSVESFGTVDGPGVRFVLFLQGCPLRCKYCHNPDTWTFDSGQQRSVDDLIAEYKKNSGFYKKGGITVTGGEPLMQIDFIIALFTRAKSEGIHTCLDTSGITFTTESLSKFEDLIAVTDLVLLDIKHIDDTAHTELCGMGNHAVLAFAKFLDTKKIPVWIRHVVVPKITDNPKYLYELGLFLGSLSNIKVIDVLPYHNMGEVKYTNLGMAYPLKDTPPLEAEKAVLARKIILHGMRQTRQKL